MVGQDPGLATLGALARAIASATEPTRIYGAIAEAAVAVLGARTARVWLNDAATDPRWVNPRFIRQLGLHAYAGLPLVAEDIPVGVLSVLYDRPHGFTDDQKALARTLADYAAITARVGELFERRREIDALRATTALAHAVAHEINNPLAIVVGHLDLLSREVADRPRAATRVERMRVAADRLTEVVRRMRQIVRLEVAEPKSPNIPRMLDLWRSSDD